MLKPKITHDIPYDEVGCELFDFEQKKYVMIVGQHSRYFKTRKRKFRTAAAVVNGMRTTIICHGILQKLRSDKGPPFNSREFSLFCDQYGIQHNFALTDV